MRRPILEPLEGRALLSTWTVNGIDDSGDGSLRWAVGKANTDTDPVGALIRFDPGVFSTPQTITLGSQLELTNGVVPEKIDATNVSAVTVSGSNATRVFQVDAGVTATFDGLTISGGLAVQGGGILTAGNLTILNSVISGNRAAGAHGDVYAGTPGGAGWGGGIFMASGSLQITDSNIVGNAATGGSGVDGWEYPYGYGYATPGGNAYGGGVFVAGGTVSLRNVGISGNLTLGGGGGQTEAAVGDASPFTGGSAYGGGLYAGGGAMNLTHVTITGNSANGGRGGVSEFWIRATEASGSNGGNAGGGGIFSGGSLSLTDSMISGNSACGGDGGAPFGSYDYGSNGYGGGAIGGGILASGSAVLVSNSFTGNIASGGMGGGYRIGAYGYVTDEAPDGPGYSSGSDIGGSVSLLQNNGFIGGTGNRVDSLTPLYVSQFVVDQGESQRSNIESVSVQFNQNTNVQSLIASGAIISAVEVAGATGALSLRVDQYHYDPSTFTLTIDLTVGAGSHRTMLSDGRYQLQLDTSQITALGSSVNHLNLQNEAPSLDGQVRYGFFRLLGDLNGDGVVNSQDLVIERNQIIGYAGALPTTYGDINGDGVVDINDYLALRLRLGKRLS
jgi:hypothetical protein